MNGRQLTTVVPTATPIHTYQRHTLYLFVLMSWKIQRASSSRLSSSRAAMTGLSVRPQLFQQPRSGERPRRCQASFLKNCGESSDRLKPIKQRHCHRARRSFTLNPEFVSSSLLERLVVYQVLHASIFLNVFLFGPLAPSLCYPWPWKVGKFVSFDFNLLSCNWRQINLVRLSWKFSSASLVQA